MEQLLLKFPPVLVGVFGVFVPTPAPPRRPSPTGWIQLPLLEYIAPLQRRDVLLRKLYTTRGNLTRSEDEEARSLLAILDETSSKALVTALVMRLDRLLVSEARRAASRTEDIEDYAQEARLLAVRALTSSRREVSRPLKPYLLGTLRRGLARVHNNRDRAIRIPERQLRRVYNLWRVTSPAEAAQLSIGEIADLLKISRVQAENVQTAISAMGAGGSIEEASHLLRCEETPEELLLAAEDATLSHHAFQDHLAALTPAQRALLAARFPPGAPARTIAGAARVAGVSLERARTLLEEVRETFRLRMDRKTR